ncbi:uncharacterized protein LOC127875418 [Dreissena polymorpha]|uniref:NACHT domain-containing protein n=1 Tax=Dreissena polymorpha TaxID=45954 RepID=A0A9D4L933_DREPO|nr:uncharacterized protein LOC127875418 [Dreissena polymorpha]KAH3853866.1 hypothetical protein DPMN_096401 [Dreissena polymorpha]
MATNSNVFTDKETNNWFKACIALNVTKEGLTNFVDKEIKKVHNAIGRSCGNCLTENLVKCPTKGTCKQFANCNFHNSITKRTRQCPRNLCNSVMKNIITQHRYNGPSWINTNAKQWSTNHWQIAKCFFPPDGYINVSSVQATDFNGVISVLLNCKHFDNCFSFTIAPKEPAPKCVLTQARELGRTIRHTPDCKVTDAELVDYLHTLDTLLADPKFLAQDPAATLARTKLANLQKDGVILTKAEFDEYLKELHRLLIKAQQTGEQISLAKESVLQEISTYMNVHTTDGLLEIEKKTHEAIQRIGKEVIKQTTANYEQASQEFARRIKRFYAENLMHVPVSPLLPSCDKDLREMYVTPIIYRIEQLQDGSRKKTDQIYTYKDIICQEDMSIRRVFLQGEPGTGKSTFAAKLVLDWCSELPQSKDPYEQDAEFDDVTSLHEFKFVFHIALRNSIDQREIETMIKDQIIDMIYAKEDRSDACKLVQQIFEKEKCLLVQDGLDDWVDSKGKVAQPIMIPHGNQCTIFITTRPWKMSDDRIKDSQIDGLVELDGVNDPFKLSERIMGCLVFDELEGKHDEFKTHIMKTCGLKELITSPMMVALLVCSWLDGIHLKGSLCEIYSILIDSLIKKASNITGYFHPPPVKCFKDTNYIQPNIAFIQALSKTAFALLFSDAKESSIVFSENILLSYVSNEHKNFALKAGILLERKTSGFTKRSITCSFIHKTLQEFLAAYHIARNEKMIDDVIFRYLNAFSDAFLEISQVFVFLCGLNIKAANQLSCLINQKTKAIGPDTDVSRKLQHMVINGYEEANANQYTHKDICLQLTHFYFDYTVNKDQNALSCIMEANASRVLSLGVADRAETSAQACVLRDAHVLSKLIKSVCKCLKYLYLDVDIVEKKMDLSSCRKLETVCVNGAVNLSRGCFLTLTDLKHLTLTLCCTWNRLDLSSCQHLRTLDLSGPGTLLPTALNSLKRLEHLTLSCACVGLDLSHCHEIETIELRGEITLQPKTLSKLTKLTSIVLYRTNKIFLKNYKTPEKFTLPLAPSIKHLKLVHCNLQSDVLCHLFDTLSMFDRNVTCTLYALIIFEKDQERIRHTGNQTYKACIHLICDEDSFFLYEALENMRIRSLSLESVNDLSIFQETIKTITGLEKLRIVVNTFAIVNTCTKAGFELPLSVNHMLLVFLSLTPSGLQVQLDKLKEGTQNCLDVVLMFGCEGPLDQYKNILTQLEAFTNVHFEKYEILDRRNIHSYKTDVTDDDAEKNDLRNLEDDSKEDTNFIRKVRFQAEKIIKIALHFN